MKKLLVPLLGLLLLVGCSSKSEDTVVVGSKNFTENEIVAELYALALEDAGYKVERKFDISSSAIHTAIMNDELDVYPEYTGTGLISVLGLEMETNPEKVYEIVKDEYNTQFDISWLTYSQANDGQGLVIRKEVAEKYNIYTISDLQKNADKIRFASQGEFDEREDGIPALERVYGEFNWKSSKVYDNSLKYQVLANDEADVAPAYTTEGNLADDQFVLLEDDKNVWPPYNLCPIVRNSVLKENENLEEVLNKVSASLNTQNITELNARVDLNGEEFEDVAKDFFEKNIK